MYYALMETKFSKLMIVFKVIVYFALMKTKFLKLMKFFKVICVLCPDEDKSCFVLYFDHMQNYNCNEVN